jgi:hypothetical protein
MDLSARLYQECSCVLGRRSVTPHLRTRGFGGTLAEPVVWESILLTVHFLCVVHAVHERNAFRRLAGLWHARRGSKATPPNPDPLLNETSKALQALELELHKEVIRPLENQIEAARESVHQLLVGYAGSKVLPTEAASQIVSRIAETLQEHARSDR